MYATLADGVGPVLGGAWLLIIRPQATVLVPVCGWLKICMNIVSFLAYLVGFSPFGKNI